MRLFEARFAFIIPRLIRLTHSSSRRQLAKRIGRLSFRKADLRERDHDSVYIAGFGFFENDLGSGEGLGLVRHRSRLGRTVQLGKTKRLSNVRFGERARAGRRVL